MQNDAIKIIKLKKNCQIKVMILFVWKALQECYASQKCQSTRLHVVIKIDYLFTNSWIDIHVNIINKALLLC